MTWPTWVVCIYGSAVALVAFWAGRRCEQRAADRAWIRARAADLIAWRQIGMLSADEYEALTRPLSWLPWHHRQRRVVTDAPGTRYMCPEHGSFIPAEPPRFYDGEPEAKCMAWLPGGLTYCGTYCKPVRR